MNFKKSESQYEDFKKHPQKLLDAIKEPANEQNTKVIRACLLKEVIRSVHEQFDSKILNEATREKLYARAYAIFKSHVQVGESNIPTRSLSELVSFVTINYFLPVFDRWYREEYQKNEKLFGGFSIAPDPIIARVLYGQMQAWTRGYCLWKGITDPQDMASVYTDAYYGFIRSVSTGSYDRDSDPIRYFKRIVFNKVIDKFRRDSKEPHMTSLDQPGSLQVDGDFDLERDDTEDFANVLVTESTDQSDFHIALLGCINALSEISRSVIDDISIRELNDFDVAGNLGVPIGTFRMRMSRIRAAIKECLKRKNFVIRF